MDYKFDDMQDWERQKAVFLMQISDNLGLKYGSSYGEIAVNPNSGYTYLWCEDYNFSLYMSINCELKKSDVVALWTNSDNGNEEEFNLKEETTLKEIEDWAEELNKTIKED
jgi:hypothetical protein